MHGLVSLFVPISIVVVLPVLIVWIVCRVATNRDNKNAEIIIKAIENNSSIDADKLVNALGKSRKTPLQILHKRLLTGCIATFIGIAAAIFAGISAYNMPEAQIHYPAMIVSGLGLAIGLAYLTVYFVTRKSVKEEGTASDDTAECA